MTNSPQMSTRDRIRRVVILCCHFARNLAYYRIGQSEEYRVLLDPEQTANANFWRLANSDFIDVCVLEWCKLFADERGKHHWKAVVTNPVEFKAGLLDRVKLDDASFNGMSPRFEGTAISSLHIWIPMPS